MRLAPGTRLGHYEIVASIGAGGMGEVYRARDPALGRDVAIKVLPAALAADADALSRFDREARSVAQLSHPNILGIFDFGRDGETAYAVMELLDGETLRARLEAGPLSARKALDIAVQVGHGLAAAHDRGIVHRDIKPENLFLTRDDRVKILDFGLARPMDLGAEAATVARSVATSQGAILGTIGYMAPEQVRGLPVDHRTDIFAFGAVLFEMLTGRRVFHGHTPADTLSAILTTDPPEIDTGTGELPPALDRLMRRCLEKKQELRFQSSRDLAFALESIGTRTTPNAAGSAIAPAEVRPARQRWLAPFALGLTAGTLLAATVVLLVRPVAAIDHMRFGRTTAVTREGGVELHPALSPDGKLIAYAAGPKERMHIFVRQLAGGSPIDLTAAETGSFNWPRWSPDGTRIAFHRQNPLAAPTGIFIVPALGGATRSFFDSTDGSPTGSPAWSPDGTAIAYTSASGVFVRGLDDSTPRRLADLGSPHSLAWSPDGRFIALVSENPNFMFSGRTLGNTAPSAIMVVPIEGGTPIDVTGRSELNMSPVWTADSRRLLFVSNAHGTRDIYEIALDASGHPGGPRQRLTTGLNAHSISLSGDATRLAYSTFSLSSDVWTIDIPARGDVSVSQATSIVRNMGSVEGTSPSPDGKWLAFDSNRAGNQDIYKIRLPDGAPEQLTTDPADDFLPQWSPDGMHLAFHSWRSGNRDVYTITAEGRDAEPVAAGPAHEFYPDWSIADRILFFTDMPGRSELSVVRRDGGRWSAPARLSATGGLARWSPDGRRAAVVNRNSSTVSVVSADGGETRVLTAFNATGELPSFPAWSADGQTVYVFSASATDRSSIWALPADGGAARLVVRFDDPTRVPNRSEFDTDGRRFFFTLGQHDGDISTMEIEGAKRR